MLYVLSYELQLRLKYCTRSGILWQICSQTGNFRWVFFVYSISNFAGRNREAAIGGTGGQGTLNF